MKYQARDLVIFASIFPLTVEMTRYIQFLLRAGR